MDARTPRESLSGDADARTSDVDTRTKLTARRHVKCELARRLADSNLSQHLRETFGVMTSIVVLLSTIPCKLIRQLVDAY